MCTYDFFGVMKEIQYVHEELYGEEDLDKIFSSAIAFSSSLTQVYFSNKHEIKVDQFKEMFLASKVWILEPRILCEEVLKKANIQINHQNLLEINR